MTDESKNTSCANSGSEVDTSPLLESTGNMLVDCPMHNVSVPTVRLAAWKYRHDGRAQGQYLLELRLRGGHESTGNMIVDCPTHNDSLSHTDSRLGVQAQGRAQAHFLQYLMTSCSTVKPIVDAEYGLSNDRHQTGAWTAQGVQRRHDDTIIYIFTSKMALTVIDQQTEPRSSVRLGRTMLHDLHANWT